VSRNSRAPTTSSLSRAITNLRTETNPIISVSSCAGDPRTVKAVSQVWVNKTVQVLLNTSSSGGSLTVGQIAKELLGSFTVTGDTVAFKVDWIKFWNYQGRLITVTLTEDNYTLNSTSTTGTDIGTSAFLPGVRFGIPLQLAKTLSGTATASTVLANYTTDGATDKVVVHVGCLTPV
jgi:hypothetical protein